jgi:hypothetical protein
MLEGLAVAAGIQSPLTHTETPEQNGKMEQFWMILDDVRKGSYDTETIANIILLYNVFSLKAASRAW